jgi:hypothetical protein
MNLISDMIICGFLSIRSAVISKKLTTAVRCKFTLFYAWHNRCEIASEQKSVELNALMSSLKVEQNFATSPQLYIHFFLPVCSYRHLSTDISTLINIQYSRCTIILTHFHTSPQSFTLFVACQ